ncbi:uncharacterized protein [Penaeus vannamei]|uniref:uncharacterized protein isoform X1 n=1 Tax=Penaeus vannamei TaxID=6689 RepID=UPI00387F8B5C
MGDINTEATDPCTDGAPGVPRENDADEEMEDSGRPLHAQNARNDEAQENGNGDGACSSELFCLISSVILMIADQILDGMNVYSFYKGGDSVFFWLSLVFTIVPALYIHLGATITIGQPSDSTPDAMKLSRWQVLLCYPFAPIILLGMAIYSHCRGNTKEKKRLRKSITIIKVNEGFFEAVPQLFIQMTALRMDVRKVGSGVIVKLVFSFFAASYALLSSFREEMDMVPQGVSVILVALVLGSRAFVCASLFSLPGPLLYTGFVPLALSFLLALAIDCVFNREKMSLNRAYIKATLLPPQDKAGVVASLVYCGFGLVFWLLTLSRPWSVLVFVGVTIIHFLGGIGWMILTKNGNKCCKGEEEP